MTDELRVALLTGAVSPYRVGVFRALSRTPDWTLRVFVDDDPVPNSERRGEADGLAVEHIAALRWPHTDRLEHTVHATTRRLPVALWWRLRRFAPDVVVSSELGARSAIAAAFAQRAGVPLALWAYHGRATTPQGALRRAFQQRLLARAAVVVGMGTQAREVFLRWGLPAERLFDAPNACDHDALDRRLAEPAHVEEVRRLRERQGPGHRLAVVVGQLIERKGIRQLCAAWRALPAEVTTPWALAFVGDGPLAGWVRGLGLPNVHVVGGVEPARVADWYAAAELHVFATRGDNWGLVVNEAMWCGTPTLCSVHAGVSDDLILPGVNGFLCDPTDPRNLLDALRGALTSANLSQLGAHGRERALGFTQARMAEGFRAAIQAARSLPGPIGRLRGPRG